MVESAADASGSADLVGETSSAPAPTKKREETAMITRRDFIRAGAAGIVFCGCGMLDAARAQSPARRSLPVMVNGKRVKTVDIHSHCLFREAIALLGDAGRNVIRNDVKGAPQQVIVVEERLKAMDAMAIDMEVLSINPFWYRQERDLAAEIVRVQNEKLAELCASHPDRFAAFASLSLQFPDLAVRQLEDGMKKYGLRGAAIGAAASPARSSPIPSFTRSGPRPRSWARYSSSTRRARPSSPSASRATAGSPTLSAIRSTPRSRCST